MNKKIKIVLLIFIIILIIVSMIIIFKPILKKPQLGTTSENFPGIKSTVIYKLKLEYFNQIESSEVLNNQGHPIRLSNNYLLSIRNPSGVENDILVNAVYNNLISINTNLIIDENPFAEFYDCSYPSSEITQEEYNELRNEIMEQILFEDGMILLDHEVKFSNYMIENNLLNKCKRII